MIGRLVLSSRNLYKISINNKLTNARKCLILSESHDDILVGTNKEFSTRDIYVKINDKNQIDQILGTVGDQSDDLDIYHYLYTNNWIGNKKYNELWNKYNLNPDFDLAYNSRINYFDKVITIDPNGSIDLDDGFSFNSDDTFYYLTIHIADPISYFDFSNNKMNECFDELINRINTCYIPNSKGSNQPIHLLPEQIVNLVSLISTNKTNSKISFRRAISFCFKINKLSSDIDFHVSFTKLSNIENKTYDEFDEEINQLERLKYKNDLTNLTNKLIKLMGLKYNLVDFSENISHKMIEIFMIWVNYYCGIYMKLNSQYMIVRKQEKKDLPENINLDAIPEYCKTFLNYSANYILTETSDIPVDHYSLGINNYTHISSPMRRIIDMLNHLLIYQIQIDKIKQININDINNKIKIQKKISNAYNLIKYLKKSNKFKAFVFDLTILENKTIGLLIIHGEENFKKMINVELPFNIKINKYDEIDIELYYNSNNWKNNKFPFSIKIL